MRALNRKYYKTLAVVYKYLLEATVLLLIEYSARITVISVLIMASPRFCLSNRTFVETYPGYPKDTKNLN
jgi:hypothetical protein